MRDPAELPDLLDRLEALHGRPRRPVPKTALEWIFWENAAYLVPDDRRRKAYRALAARTGPTADGVLALPREELRELAGLGGMMADGRVAKWLSIAETARADMGGDVEAALALPLTKARSALRRFPGIGAPGADKILLFTRTHALAAFESNGLRALVRLGFAEEAKSYSTTYRGAVRAFDSHLERGCPWLMRAHQLLRTHGQETCRNNGPRCEACCEADSCPAAE